MVSREVELSGSGGIDMGSNEEGVAHVAHIIARVAVLIVKE